MSKVIRSVSVVLAVVSTLAYLFALYVATYACYGESVGWTARTIVTVVYVAVVVLLVAATRLMLRRYGKIARSI